ncbi:MAG: hypothetical protein JXB43_05510 [Dehalococcoidia bacterium]|nr:hypothetical protein [Dehalococcoidia bacterium]
MNAVRGFFSGVFCFLLFDVLALLGVVITLNMTVLNPDFVTSELDKLDVYSVVIEQVKSQLPGQEFIDAETVDEIVTELTPWFEEQADAVIHSFYAYFKGEQELNVVVSLEPVRDTVKEKARETILGSLPPELQGVPQSVIDTYMARIYGGIDDAIPPSFVLSEAVAGSQVMAQLKQIKQIVGYIDTVYKALIIVAVVLVLLIALVHWWQPKPITRSIGITFILVGVACIISSLLDVWIAQALSRLVGESSILLGLEAKLPQLAADFMAPVRMYGIGFLVSGIVLVVISFLFRSPETRPDVKSAY